MKSMLMNTNLFWQNENIFWCEKSDVMKTLYGVDRGTISGGMGAVTNAVFGKLKKKCPDFGENVLIVLIYGLNGSFKITFYEHLGEKTSKIFTAASFLHLL